MVSTKLQDFPRGGASDFNPLEYRDISDKVKEDVLFGVYGLTSEAKFNKKSKKRIVDNDFDSKSSLPKKSKTDFTALTVPILSYKKLDVGMCLLGVVKDINSLEMVVSLPNQLTGFVSLTEISDYISKQVEAAVDSDNEDEDTDMNSSAKDELDLPSLESYFQIGQSVVCKIISADQTSKNKRIDLSLKPEAVNEGIEKTNIVSGMVLPMCVTSKEDHGYILSLGIKGVSGFLKNEHASAYLSSKNLLGKTFCLVSLNLEYTKIISLTFFDLFYMTELSHIRPGSLVTATIQDVLENGLALHIFKFFSATIDWFHLGNGHISDKNDIKNQFKKGQKVASRVLYLNTAEKKIGLTLIPELILQKSPNFKSFEIGTVSENITVLRVDPLFGLLVQYPGDRLGYVHMSRIADDHITKIDKAFRTGTTHRGRIVDHDYCNNLLLIAFAPKIVNQPFLRLVDIKAGIKVKGQIRRITPSGVVVSVTDSINGFCPSNHFSDVKIARPEKLFKEGATVAFHVLSVNSADKQLILTHKKSLMESKLPTITSYTEAQPGQITMGIITSVKNFGCIVSFYNNVHAIVPIVELSETRMDTPQDHFKIGQAIKCRVVSVDALNEKMCASFKLAALGNKLDSVSGTSTIQVGQIYDGIVVTKSKDTVISRVNDTDLVSISKSHLSDYPTIAQSLYDSLNTGSKITGLLAINIDKYGKPLITRKHSLIFQVQQDNGVRKASDMINDQVCFGFVRNIYGKLCFVEFTGGVVGAVSLQNISDNFVSSVSEHLQIGQSVTAYQVPAWTATQVAFTQQRILAMLPKATKVKDMVQNRVLENPVDPHLSSLQSIKPDMLIKCTVKSFDDTYINVCIADNLDGRIQATEIFDSFDQITDPKQPMASFQIGQSLQAKVIEVHIFKPHFHMTTNDKKSPKKVWIDLTVRPSFIATENALTTASQIRPKLKTLEIGSEHIGCIQHIGSRTLRILIQGGLLGDVFNMDISKDVDVVNNASSHFAVGQLIKCFVIFKDTQKKTFNLSLVGASQKPVDMFSVGQKVVGYVAKIDPLKGINIRIGSHIIARVHITDLADEFNESPTDIYTIRQLVQAVVVRIDTENNLIHCSLRKSAFKPDTKFPIFPFSSFQKGSIVQGYIQSISEKGCFVGLTNDIYGRVKMCELSDSFVVDWKSAFKPGMLVKGRIISINTNSKQIELSFKKSLVTNDAGNLLKFSDIKVGQKSEGVIRRIEDYGLFIVLKNSELCGLCHVLEVADRPVKNLESLYSIGDSVMTVVLRTNPKKQQISLSIKPSRFNDDDVLENSIEEAKVQSSESENDSAFVDDEENDEMEQSDDEDINFSWDTQPTAEKSVMHDSDSDSSSDSMQSGDDESDGDQQNKNKRKRRAKKRERAQEEKRIANKELELVEGDHPPETAEDFERLLLGSPNNSYIWIKYMVFYLNMAEIEKARQVAERALKTINFREEQERLNIWIAFLNLENTYGNVDTLSKVLERAIQMNDAKTVYFHMAKIYERTGKDELCIKLYQTMCKKFKDSRQVWVSYACFLLTHGKQDAARQLLSRSMQSLPKRKHVDVTSKFAQLEFNHGEPERGRTIFEGLMNSCPKRTDLWSVYIDMEIRAGDISIVRRLFDRVVQREWSARKMKFFFKKYFEFEKKHGDENGVQNVKQAAIKFVESL
ncbi:hypothetical protein BATDEDRAFT_13567 [Batrachochytrium dendrobatidis JAM81]|uniref:S1 motif domain-containing protein n=1 Tax=Batrachochytrium dendrobatidis (strain JAM81 / FGSC 10211) TaxID=684364 RepID=F4P9V6_BATDJ|nr:uncharacterized protein BATDEDRAFT_13567 [Batrachochytrium dendrobatidis JAM81]EGF78009.1 hypothetical protein BATDEDRAFT_13567 [Batrachochytrium dendrobatidis JAM81]|eukprot:XP_006681327.1 hypothetical protein BATDEDRAFT_13567 [Batrachochytrium dendrobatidis JAM81]